MLVLLHQYLHHSKLVIMQAGHFFSSSQVMTSVPMESLTSLLILGLRVVPVWECPPLVLTFLAPPLAGDESQFSYKAPRLCDIDEPDDVNRGKWFVRLCLKEVLLKTLDRGQDGAATAEVMASSMLEVISAAGQVGVVLRKAERGPGCKGTAGSARGSAW